MELSQSLSRYVDDLRQTDVGKEINQLPKPSVVLDRAKMERHCQSLLHAVESLGVDFRAHIKTHKTKEGVRLQAGKCQQVRLVASTVSEIGFIQSVLQEFQQSGRHVNILHGIPLPASQVDRLASIGKLLGQGTISVLVDHASQLDYVSRFYEQTGFPAGVYVKVDTGYHRAGLPPTGINKDGLIARLIELDIEGRATFTGVYSHSSLSYNDSSPTKAMANLEAEIQGCLDALHENAQLFPFDKEVTISVGASPQVTSVENLLGPKGTLSNDAEHLRQMIGKVNKSGRFHTKLELHAGVYSILDVQQLSTHSRAFLGDYEEEIAISVMAEVCSVYNNGEREQPEALVAVGVLGLGREPCVAYEGWGVVDREAYPLATSGHRLIVKRISQEHCIVAWGRNSQEEEAGSLPPIPLKVGQTIRIYPNHACVTGALYNWYHVVDSSSGEGRQVVDVWARARGW